MERTFQGLQNRTNRDFFIFFCITVTAFPRYTTVLWLLDFGQSDLFTLIGNSFPRKNSYNKNQMTVGKNFSGATKQDQPRFSIFFCLKVTAFPRYTTVLCLLDYRHSDLFTLVGYSFVREDSNVNQSAKGIKWSAVSLPCLTSLVFMGGSRAAGPIEDKVL